MHQIRPEGRHEHEHENEMKAHRGWLVEAEHKASQAYDKAVMTLSGGALGISLTFAKHLVKSPVISLWRLELAWGALSASIALILVSMVTSQFALRKSIHEFDQGMVGRQPGGSFSVATQVLNVMAGITLVLGIALLAWFSVSNF